MDGNGQNVTENDNGITKMVTSTKHTASGVVQFGQRQQAIDIQQAICYGANTNRCNSCHYSGFLETMTAEEEEEVYSPNNVT